MNKYLKRTFQLAGALTTNPSVFKEVLGTVPAISSAYRFSRAYDETARPSSGVAPVPVPAANPLWEYFQNHKEGRGVWKWEHYFEIYHRHFARFVGQKVNLLEIGVYSGGSLEMWRSYFGEQCHIYGVDIEESCRTYADDHTSIFIGDQADRSFWRTFKESAAAIDIVIDDGGHSPEQQQTTLEEMLPHLRPGGVFLCEDILGVSNKFAAYAAGLVSELNRFARISTASYEHNVTPCQSAIHSIHFYPYVLVIEKHRTPPTQLACPKHGTQWQNFGKGE